MKLRGFIVYGRVRNLQLLYGKFSRISGEWREVKILSWHECCSAVLAFRENMINFNRLHA